jgi:DNA-binding SARP family transcriptional activator
MHLTSGNPDEFGTGSRATVSVGVLGGFECDHDGRRVRLPLGAQRLLALLALSDGGTHRSGAAERLWPDSPAKRAAGNLRSALSQGRRVAQTTVIESLGSRLRLAPSVLVDLHDVQRRAKEALDHPSLPTDLACESLAAALGRELLPEWSDDWLMLERQRWEQVRLYALEGLAEALLGRERYLAAMKTALAAIAVEPVRETAHRTVVQVHLAQGNPASAIVHYQRYRALLRRELGVGPSSRLTRLITSVAGAVLTKQVIITRPRRPEPHQPVSTRRTSSVLRTRRPSIVTGIVCRTTPSGPSAATANR